MSNIKSEKLSSMFDGVLNTTGIEINYNVHIFYYAWYANKDVDKSWKHWNHARLAHWNKALQGDFDQSEHNPPDDIGADFYPALGLYSSKDKQVRQTHLAMIRYTGVGVVVFSWYPGNKSDPNGNPVDYLFPEMLNDAHSFNLKVAIHIEPYEDRSALSVKKDLLYIYSRYSRHPAYFRRARFGQENPVPVVFIYDSYRIPGSDWYKVLGKNQPFSIRKKKEDFFVVGLHFERDSCSSMSASGFDAAYSYFASDKMTYASSFTNWKDISESCSRKNVLFFPSLGPGYKDISVRPWNSATIQERNNGKYFVEHFLQVQLLNIASFGITSFNEWHEGTQIEPAVPHSSGREGRPSYDDYLPQTPMFYLDLTRAMVHSFTTNTSFHL